jgi:hypothetical protein
MAGFYVSDLDGTLLNRDATLSESTRAGLQRLIAEGLIFSVASARSVISMQPLLSGLKLNLPVIEFNGAFVSDLQTGQHEIVNAIDPAVAREVFELFRRWTASLFVSTFDGTEDRLYYSEITNDGASYYVANRQNYNDPRLRCVHDVASRLIEQVVCLTVIGKLESLEELELVVRDRFQGSVEIHLFENQYSPGWYWLTVHDSRATKDQAIEAIRNRYGFSDHELIVFGDHTNDIKMFRIATHAIAMANAHPEVKRHATHVVGSNDEDSVVRFIEEHYSANR